MLLAEHSPSVTQELGLSVGYAETRVPRNEVEPGPCGGGGGLLPNSHATLLARTALLSACAGGACPVCFFWPQDLARQPLLANLLLHSLSGVPRDWQRPWNPS